MNIAYTIAQGRGDTDLLLFSVAQSLLARGCRVAGTVQINTERAITDPCDMDIKVLPDGPVIRISQDLGPHSKGCRLDTGALETAVYAVGRHLADGPDCLIVNKFGKHEAEGRGFREVIAEAVSREIPVLVGLNRLNETAFAEFAGGVAANLPPDRPGLEAWILDRTPRLARAG